MRAHRLLVVDDQAPVRAAIRRLLAEADPGFEVGEAASGPAALELCRTQAWDVVVLDINMPGMNGMQVLDRLRVQAPTLPVVMCSLLTRPALVAEAFQRGALAFVAKDDLSDELVPAIESALRRQLYRSRTIDRNAGLELAPIAPHLAAWRSRPAPTDRQDMDESEGNPLAGEFLTMLVKSALLQQRSDELRLRATIAMDRSREVCERARGKRTRWMNVAGGSARMA